MAQGTKLLLKKSVCISMAVVTLLCILKATTFQRGFYHANYLTAKGIERLANFYPNSRL